MEISEDWDGTPQWEQGPKVPEKHIHYVDANVKSRLPDGARSLEVITHGLSYWTRTARIVAAEQDGARVSYFLKVSIGDDGRDMMRGEFESMRALHETAPDLAPKPIAWGTYATDEDVHFFLCAFHDMDKDLCSLNTFPVMLAGLHRRGAARSNGKFGFPVTTYQGRLAQDMTWCDTWEESFSRNLDLYFEHELEAQGPDEEIGLLRRVVMDVTARILYVVTGDHRRHNGEGCAAVTAADGDWGKTGDAYIDSRRFGEELILFHVNFDCRKLTPVPQWEGNAGTDRNTRVPKIFDACSWYAHHEFELAPWRPARQKMGAPYVEAYLKHFPASEPAEDFDGRNALYALRFNLCSSGLYPGNLNYRNVVHNDMRELIARFPETFEEWESSRVSSDKI